MAIILSLVDQSRTFLLVSLVCAFVSLRIPWKSMFPWLVFLASAPIVVASLRSGWGLFDVLTSIQGESSLATISYYKLSGLTYNLPNQLNQLLYLFLLPVLWPLYKIAAVLGISLHYLPHNLVSSDVLELQVMGGDFILSHFAPFGALGFAIAPLYLIYISYITDRTVGSYSPLISFPLSILSIKASPEVYWNYVFVLLFVLISICYARRLAIDHKFIF
jgi:hypothetical protein